MKRIIFAGILWILGLVYSAPLTAQHRATDSMDVHHYHIDLDFVHLSGQSLSGFAELTLQARYPADQHNLYFDLLMLHIDSILVDGQVYPYHYNDTLITLPASGLDLYDTLTVVIYYHGQPVVESANWGGFHILNDSSMAYNLGIGFQADPHNYGRVWFPCVDNFTDRATYSYHIHTKGDQMAVCGGVLDSVTVHGNGHKTWHWDLKQTIPTYLASVAVSDFSEIEQVYPGVLGDIPVFLHVVPSDSSDALTTFSGINSALQAFESAFGPYRWPRVGFVGTPKGAMEHAMNIAFPRHAIDGTLNYERLVVHELAHSWFGNLVTCKTAADMWLNEGWAVYSEAIFRESTGGKEAYLDYMREKRHEVIKTAHVTDDGYRAVYGLPQAYTYGATVYDKGATVVHALRNYLGDSLFFHTTRAYLDTFAFGYASTQDMNQFFNQYSGINLDAFFDAWVYRPGFSHFSIDSFNVYPSGADYEITLYLRQRLLGTTQMADDNRLEVGFVDDQQNIIREQVQFSGPHSWVTLTLPFYPQSVMMDPGEKMSHATTDRMITLKGSGLEEFHHTYAGVEVEAVNDSALVRISHNWVAPANHKTEPPLYHVSGKRYWKVEGVFSSGFRARGHFEYVKSSLMDGELVNSVMDTLSLLYKKCLSDPWKPLKYSRMGTLFNGVLITDSLMPGYYTLGRYDKSLGVYDKEDDKKHITIIPNPASQYVDILVKDQGPVELMIYTVAGQMVTEKRVEGDNQAYRLSMDGLKPGVYLLRFRRKEQGLDETHKLVVQ